jgi:hypothetical protein
MSPPAARTHPPRKPTTSAHRLPRRAIARLSRVG